MRQLLDENDEVLGHLDASGKFVSTDARTAGWDEMVFAVKATEEADGTITEGLEMVSASDPRYGAAFAEAIEERGWRFEEVS